MGTTCTVKPTNVKKSLIDSYTWENETHKHVVLKSALCNLLEFYCAVETTEKKTGNKEIWAGMTKISYFPKDYYGFCTKQLDETVGPNYYNCPKAILDILTPSNSDYANSWRKACRDNLEKKAQIRKRKIGDTLTSEKGIYYGNYGYVHSFELTNKKPLTLKVTDRESCLFGYQVKITRAAYAELVEA